MADTTTGRLRPAGQRPGPARVPLSSLRTLANQPPVFFAQMRDRYGPFVLAYLETLVRIADWRASAEAEEVAE